MAMDASEIEKLIKAGIPDAEVTIRDLAGDGDHYAATVIAASFRGKSRVQQHQLVYQALQGRNGRQAARAGAADRRAGGLTSLEFQRRAGLRPTCATYMTETLESGRSARHAKDVHGYRAVHRQ